MYISSYLQVTSLEGGTRDDAALFHGPGRPVAVGGTGVGDQFGIWAAGRNLPAVTKYQNICNSFMGPCSEIILAVAIIVSTQTTHLTLPVNTIVIIVSHNNHVILQYSQNAQSHDNTGLPDTWDRV